MGESFTGNIRLVLTAVCKDVVPGTCNSKAGPPLFLALILEDFCTWDVLSESRGHCFHNQETEAFVYNMGFMFLCVIGEIFCCLL